MRNELIMFCEQINACGVSGTDEISSSFRNNELLKLGNFLLNSTNPQKKFRLKLKPVGNPTVDVIVPLSGGMDSFCALHHALRVYDTVGTLTLKFSTVSTTEFEIANRIGYAASGCESNEWSQYFSSGKKSRYHITDFSDIKSADSGLDWENYIIPARNLIIAAHAAKYSNLVWIASHKRTDESVGAADKTSRFYNSSSHIFSEFYGRNVRVCSPFSNISKRTMVDLYLRDGGSIEALAKTVSCYTPFIEIKNSEEKFSHCGQCYACYKRYKLFQSLNYEVSFSKHPAEGKNFSKFQEAESKKGR